MRWLRILLLTGLAIGATSSLLGDSSPADAKTEILAGTSIEADHTILEPDDTAVTGILAAFHRAEAAIEVRDLDALMAFYSKSYSYHGLRKSDIRKIWAELFARYEKFSTTHLFTRVVLSGTGNAAAAELTCTGALWGTASETGKRVTIDSWYSEVHYLVNEDGTWRILGNAGEAPSVLLFGNAPHPLF